VEELGRIYFAPVDVRLSPHDIVQPDILFIRRDRLASYQPGGVVEGAPDLVVEIATPTSRLQDDGPKKALYARAGVREYWLVDPAAGGLRVFVQNERGDRFGELAPEHRVSFTQRCSLFPPSTSRRSSLEYASVP